MSNPFFLTPDRPKLLAPRDNPRFMQAMHFVLGQEGTPGQPFEQALWQGRGVTGQAVQQYLRTHPKESAQYYSSDHAVATESRLRLWHDIWQRSGAENLPPALGLVHFDAAVNHGPTRAMQLLTQSRRDPGRYLALREEHYRSIPDTASEGGLASNPGWLAKRLPALRTAVENLQAHEQTIARLPNILPNLRQ